MVFNIASAALIYQSYQQNSTTAIVTYTEFALSITQLVLVCLNIVGIWGLINKGVPVLISFSLLTIQCFNIAYSAYIIEYYNNHSTVTPFLNNIALAIIILNALSICGCCVGRHQTIHEQVNVGGPEFSAWWLNEISKPVANERMSRI
jgi:hypothetical protein